MQATNDYIIEDHLPTTDFKDNNPPLDNEDQGDSSDADKTIDSEVDASENVKVTSNPQKHQNEEVLFTDSDLNNYESTTKFESNKYFVNNISAHNDHHTAMAKPLQNNSHHTKIVEHGKGDIIIGSEKKHDQYLSYSSLNNVHNANNQHNVYVSDASNDPERNIPHSHDTIDLKPPEIIAVFEPNGHSRPYSKLHTFETNSQNKPDIITESPEQIHNIFKGHMRPGLGQVLHVQADKNEIDNNFEKHRNESLLYSHRGRPRPDYATRIHPEHPQIVTKSKPQLPGPVVISSGKMKKQNSNRRRPSVKFSLPIDSTGEENESKTQTERPPSADADKTNIKSKQESLATAFQTNYAHANSDNEQDNDKEIEINVSYVELQKTTPKTKLHEDMLPPAITSTDNNKEIIKNQLMDEILKPPPSPNDVLGLSPPPVDITTTNRPLENKQSHQKITSDVSGLKPPPLYIPLKESSITPPLPSISMVPPNPRPSVVRPYLADILSEVLKYLLNNC
jgi:hypothetical protein